MGNQHARRQAAEQATPPPRSNSFSAVPRSPHKLPAPHERRKAEARQVFRYSLHLDNDPSDREYVVNCPTCSAELFDNGLSQTLKCPRCKTEFDTESRKMFKAAARAAAPRFSLHSRKPRAHTICEGTKQSMSSGGDDELEEEKRVIPEPVDIEQDLKSDCSGGSDSVEETESDGSSQESKENHAQRVSACWNFFRKTQPGALPKKEIVHLQLFCNKATLIQDFLDAKDEAKSQLIIQKLLVPFFQIKSRVVTKGLFFRIGDLQFYVANCIPDEGGKVTSRTVLHPPLVTNFDQHVETLRLITTRRLHEHKSFVLKNSLIPYFKEHQRLVHLNGSFWIGEGEFYVRYCRPQFGIVDERTEIRLEASTLKEVHTVNILPIWEDEAHFRQVERQGQALYQGGYKEMLMLDFVVPYFLEAGQRRYVERGDTYRIGEINFYINGCNPKSGVIGRSSHLELERGITKSTFHRKIVMADQRIAERLQSREDIVPVQELDITNLVEAPRRPRLSRPPGLEISNRLDHIAQMITQIRQNLAPEARGVNPARVSQFPTRVTTAEYVERQKEDYALKLSSGERMEYEAMDQNPNLTCMICLMQYEAGDECRTLPCIHYFHTVCIDNWLERGTTCPICKLDLDN